MAGLLARARRGEIVARRIFIQQVGWNHKIPFSIGTPA